MKRRFRSIAKEIRESVSVNDCFGLKDQPVIFEPISPREFAFRTDPEKVDEFMGWLRKQADSKVLQVEVRDGSRVLSHTPWMNTYIHSAYRQGRLRGVRELQKAGYYDSDTAKAVLAIAPPIHAEVVAMAYIRAYNELQGITDAMSQQISRVLAQGLIDGRPATELAKEMVNRVEHVGDLSMVDSLGRFISAKRRAVILARTETVRAHHFATIETYREAGVEGITVKAEWRTAGDAQVCPICAPLEGTVYSLDEIKDMIPAHPECRCVAIPVGVGEDKEKRLEVINRTRSRLGVPQLDELGV